MHYKPFRSTNLALRFMLLATLLICLVAGCGGTDTVAVSTPANPDEQPATRVLDRQLQDSEDTREQRQRLVDNYIAPVVSDARVVAASQAVPRHSFIPTESFDYAYYDHALPIGYGQTISQPSLVATMTELLELEDGDRVLEIGTGSGYQAAILRELTDEVYSIEIIPQLLDIARQVLDTLGYGDIHLLRADGYNGWPEYAPYDAIIVTAAPDHLPTPLVEQLSPEGGRMVIPIGPVGNVQTLWLVTRQQDEVQMERIMSVVFVPFTREQEP